MDIRQNIAQRAMEMGGRLRVRSALNPILWLCAIVTIPGMVIMGISDKPLPLFAQLVIFSPVCIAVFGFLYLLFIDRDKLQSEDYQIRKRTIEEGIREGKVTELIWYYLNRSLQ